MVSALGRSLSGLEPTGLHLETVERVAADIGESGALQLGLNPSGHSRLKALKTP
jgi:hypothetical protein